MVEEVLCTGSSDARPHLATFAEMLCDLFRDPPFNFDWRYGDHDDPSSALGFLSLLESEGATFWHIPGEDGAIASFAFGIVLTQRVIEALGLANFEGTTHPQVGDYYCAGAATAKPYRKRGYFSHLAERRLDDARAKGCRRVWVRTHTQCGIVRHTYGDNRGFEIAGTYTANQGSGTMTSVMMYRDLVEC